MTRHARILLIALAAILSTPQAHSTHPGLRASILVPSPAEHDTDAPAGQQLAVARHPAASNPCVTGVAHRCSVADRHDPRGTNRGCPDNPHAPIANPSQRKKAQQVASRAPIVPGKPVALARPFGQPSALPLAHPKPARAALSERNLSWSTTTNRAWARPRAVASPRAGAIHPGRGRAAAPAVRRLAAGPLVTARGGRQPHDISSSPTRASTEPGTREGSEREDADGKR